MSGLGYIAFRVFLVFGSANTLKNLIRLEAAYFKRNLLS